MNVSTLSLAGLGPEPARVKITVVPRSQWNLHRLEIEGKFGKLKVEIEDAFSDITPRPSNLAYLSAFTRIEGITATSEGGLARGPAGA